VKNPHKIPNPGDLVMLYNIGKSTSLVIWASWSDHHDESKDEFWPKIIGELRENETALVFEILYPPKGPIGARICTERNIVGWISAKHLRSVT
jgi:hypothetical protein